MAYTLLLQDWLTLTAAASASGTVTITQSADGWIDSTSMRDVVFYLSTKNVAGGVGSPTLTLQTSPSLNDELFMTAASAVALVANDARTIKVAAAAATIPCAAYLRWRMSLPPGCSATFRIYLGYTLQLGVPSALRWLGGRRSRPTTLQSWVNVKAAAGASVVQDASEWLDLQPYDGLCLTVYSGEVTVATQTDFHLETSVNEDPAMFVSMGSIRLTVNQRARVIWPFGAAAVPLARYVRWRVTNTLSAFVAQFYAEITAFSNGDIL